MNQRIILKSGTVVREGKSEQLDIAVEAGKIALVDKNIAPQDGDKVIDCKLTAKGYAYICSNPHLHNPVNWSAIAAIASIVTAIATTLALCVACNK